MLAAFLVLFLTSGLKAWPLDPDGPRDLVVQAGRPLRVALDARLRIQRVGQRVSATLVEDVYAFDRIVVPKGTKVIGHVESLVPASGRSRLAHGLRLDISTPRGVVLQFDRLVMNDGLEWPILTKVGPGMADMVFQSAPEPKRNGIASGVRRQAAQAITDIKRPGKLRRLKDAVLASLPFHRQYLPAGTVFDAELLEPVRFGIVTPTPLAVAGEGPAPDSIVTARLVTNVDSRTTPRGTRIRAVLTQPVFSAQNRLIFPEGTALAGEVTFARPARHFRRNGQLRMLFDAIQPEERAAEPFLASLHGAEISRGARLAVDDEGGATITNTAARFIAPALSAAALGAAQVRESIYDPGEGGFAAGATESSTLGAGASGFAGVGLLGIALTQAYRPAGVVLGFVGLARSGYSSIFGKGREVSFRPGTRIQVQLASDPTVRK